jgi:hypothetical protein
MSPVIGQALPSRVPSVVRTVAKAHSLPHAMYFMRTTDAPSYLTVTVAS